MSELSPMPPETDAVDEGRRVLEAEAEALLALARDMPPDFEAVVALLLAAPGRVVVSGVGKSGHVGRKISSTLASTGTASHFVHAAEASHGDLGMVGREDVCLLISNSGETSELSDIIAHTRRFAIPMVAISSKGESTLARAADHRLILPPMPEACPIGMAPTTSTTMTLALGDALAVALMKRRGFLPEDFKVFHPGGKLGAQMKRVGDLMHTGDEVPLVEPGTSMFDTILTMTAKGFGIAGLVEDGRLAGVVSDGDLRRNADALMDRPVDAIASRDPLTVSEGMLAAGALAQMNARRINALIVVDDDGAGRPVGVLHLHDLLRAGVV